MKKDKETVPLKEFVEARIHSVEKAITLQAAVLEVRMEAANKFREQLREQATGFVSKAEHAFVLTDIKDLRESRAEAQGKASQWSVMWSYAIGLVGIFIAVMSYLKK